MSVKLMGQVWELQLNHSQQSIALALADHAHDDGTNIYPGIEYLEWKTGYSARNIIRILADLESIGLIEPVDGQSIGRGNVQEYSMDVTAIPKKEPFRANRRSGSHAVKRDTVSAFTKHDNLSKGDKRNTENMTNETIKHDKSDTLHNKDHARVLTIIEPSGEPSKESAANADAPQWPAPQKSSKPPKPKPPTLPDGHPMLVAVFDVLGITPHSTDSARGSAQEAAVALLRAGRSPDEVMIFKKHWWSRSYWGFKAKPTRRPKPAELRNEFDEILALPKIEQEQPNGTNRNYNQSQPHETAAQRRERKLRGLLSEIGGDDPPAPVQHADGFNARALFLN